MSLNCTAASQSQEIAVKRGSKVRRVQYASCVRSSQQEGAYIMLSHVKCNLKNVLLKITKAFYLAEQCASYNHLIPSCLYFSIMQTYFNTQSSDLNVLQCEHISCDSSFRGICLPPCLYLFGQVILRADSCCPKATGGDESVQSVTSLFNDSVTTTHYSQNHPRR